MVNLIWLILAGSLLLYWWHSGSYKGRARALVLAHCQPLDLQLLDQSMVIQGVWPIRNTRGGLALRRKYQFEFTSTGEQRYQGLVVLQGMHLQSIQTEVYKVAE
jgi:hypothetical protein